MLAAAALSVAVSVRGWGDCEKQSIKSQITQHTAGATVQLRFTYILVPG